MSYDLKKYIESDVEGRLKILIEAITSSKDEEVKTFLRGQMIGLTIDLDEHPEWYDWECLCSECLQYGD